MPFILLDKGEPYHNTVLQAAKAAKKKDEEKEHEDTDFGFGALRE